MSDRAPTAVELLAQGEGMLTRTHLRELGLGRSAIDSVFREIARSGGIIVFPGSSRPHVSVRDYLALVEQSTYRDGTVRSTTRR